MTERAFSEPAAPGPVGGDLDGEDRRVLEFAAAHSVFLVSHVRALLGVEEPPALERLDRLRRARLLNRAPRLRHQLANHMVSARGLRAVESELEVPRIDLRAYWQEIDRAWLWLAADAGTFGELDGVYSRRQMQAADARAVYGEEVLSSLSPTVRAKAHDVAFAVRLSAPAEELERSVYPDLAMVGPAGRIAVHLQSTPGGRQTLEELLVAYQRKPSIAAVLFLTDSRPIAGGIQAAAARLGMSKTVQVQPMRASHRSR